MEKFIDGGNLEIDVDLIDRIVRIEVDDFERSQRFRIDFLDCRYIAVEFSAIEVWDESDLSNLAQGIVGESPRHGGSHAFRIMFSDDSVLQVECNHLEQNEIPGFRAADKMPPTD